MPKETWEAVKRSLGIEINTKQIERDAKAAQRVAARKEESIYFDLKIIKQPAYYEESINILKENGLRPLTCREALSRAPELIEKLKGENFFLAEKIRKFMICYAYNEHGELLKPTRTTEIPDQIALIWPRRLPNYLTVCSDFVSKIIDARFSINGVWKADRAIHIASVIVGVQAGQEETISEKRTGFKTKLKSMFIQTSEKQMTTEA